MKALLDDCRQQVNDDRDPYLHIHGVDRLDVAQAVASRILCGVHRTGFRGVSDERMQREIFLRRPNRVQ